MSEQIENYVRYWPFYKAVQENDWKGVADFISQVECTNKWTAKLKVRKDETIFHVLTQNLEVPIRLMERLASVVAPELLELGDENIESPIFLAALLGNTNATKAFVRRNKNLPNISNSEDFLPIELAAMRGHEEVFRYLLPLTILPLVNEKIVTLLQNLITAGLCGAALDFLRRYPKLPHLGHEDRGEVLLILANTPLQFKSGSRHGYWKRLAYKWIPVQEEPIPRPDQNMGADVENPSQSANKKFTQFGFLGWISTTLDALYQKSHVTLSNALMQLIPVLKHIRDKKLKHRQTLKMVKIMCHEDIIWEDDQAREFLRMPLLTAAELGIYELVDEVLQAYFDWSSLVDKSGSDVFRLAILHRREKVFGLVTRKTKNISLTWHRDMNQVVNTTVPASNILHFAARLVLPGQVLGAALQMQRELQWFNAVSSCVHPFRQEQRDELNKTPREVFTEEHAHLVKKGEKWMKETASSCTVVAALIITVVFAAAFTVPGGNDCTGGLPIFLHKPSFIVFVISDALALFSSTSSVLMFLAILTSRYAEEDFLESLPRTLIIGLITLFFSIACMMVAFGATIYIFLSHPWKWTMIPISLFGCLPVTLFALSQFPLLVEMFSSTYRPPMLQPMK